MNVHARVSVCVYALGERKDHRTPSESTEETAGVMATGATAAAGAAGSVAAVAAVAAGYQKMRSRPNSTPADLRYDPCMAATPTELLHTAAAPTTTNARCHNNNQHHASAESTIDAPTTDAVTIFPFISTVVKIRSSGRPDRRKKRTENYTSLTV